MTERSETDESEYLTPAEAATALHVSTRTLARMADDGDIESFSLPSRHRRYRRADVDRLLAHRAEDIPA